MYMHAQIAPPPSAAPVSEPGDEALAALFAGRSLSQDEAEQLFAELVAGRLSEPSIAALLIALKLKGESADELIGAARALRAADAPFPRPEYLFADSCGTGGDGSGTINLSTAVAFVAAAAGLPVAKHGNRSVTSRCGSADVLEHLGAGLDASPEASRRALDETGFCFLFAPAYHPGLKHAGPVRRALKVRTIMNVLGPCVNPAEPPVQLLGVADARLLDPIAQTLRALGVERALVVHGSGLDEVALHGETQAIRLYDGLLETLILSPEQAGIERRPLAGIKGGGVEENADRLRALLLGFAPAAEADIVALNAGALLMTAGLAADLKHGTAQAARIIASGKAHNVLRAYIAATNA